MEMTSVEPHENPSKGLNPFSNGVEMFDTFKSVRGDDRDSDEESFHLPILDSDDDNKDMVQNGETEEDILNRFDTGTPDLDSKCDDSILNDKDEQLDNVLKSDDESEKDKNVDVTSEQEQNKDVIPETENTGDVINETDNNGDVITETENNRDVITENNGDVSLNKEKEIASIENENQDSVTKTEENEEKPVTTDTSKEESKEKEAEDLCNSHIEVAVEDSSNTISDTIMNNIDSEKISESTEEKVGESNISGHETDKVNGKDLSDSVEVTEKEIDVAEGEEDSMEVDDNSKEVTSNQVNQKTEEQPDINKSEKVTESSPENTEVNEKCDKLDEKSEKPFEIGQEEIATKKESLEEEMELDKTLTETNDDTNKDLTEAEADKTGIGEEVVSEKSEQCQKAEESKSDNLECDDLLNISVIRDVDEDNAAAIAEHNNEINSSEKSDNEEQDDDKGENEIDDSEMDQDDNINSSDKDENMEYDDENSSNSCDRGTTINKDFDNDSNSASNKDQGEMITSTAEVSAEPAPKSDICQENGPTKISTDEKEKDPLSESCSQNKRPLTEVNDDCAPKKIRLSDNIAPAELLKPLNSFREFMQSRKMKNKLTRSDLEQFVIQKICEVIMHKHEIGELHQTLKKQEQTIENLRKDVQQLSKQTRDLDIVNKKLLTELKLQNGNKKPLVPLKITRSVGLQVKLNLGNDTVARRKSQVGSQNNVASQRTPIQNTPVQRNRSFTPTNNTVVRKIASSPRKTPQPQQTQQQQQQQQPAPSPKTPILSQALQQTRQNAVATPPVKRTPVKKQQPEAAKPNAGVIDLTDEDDKAAKSQTTNTFNKVVTKTIPLTIQKGITLTQSKQVGKNLGSQTKTITVRSQVRPVAKQDGTPRTITSLPQGVRMTPSQMKSSITIPTTVMTSNSGAPAQVMYVVQPSSVVTSSANGNQKTLLLNFQPNNGVLTSTLNGSSVSVISKPGNSVLKPIQPKKHPAPLPLPIPVSNNSNLKPLLPKPVLSIRKTDTGIILQWRMPYNLDLYEGIASYQLFAYQETQAPPSTDMWRKVGDVKALALPMACTLTQFVDKNKYYFAVRSVDIHKRLGAFSDPEEISL